MVIRAMPLLRQRIQGVTYLIVGDGPHRQELQRLVDDTGVRECVVFAGEAKAADLPDIYALGDVFVMPNREQKDACDVEGFGLVFLEANACGKPVVGGRSGGVVDAVVDGRTGLLVDPTNLEEVSAAIEKLLTNHELARLMGEQGRSRVVADFSWPGVASRVQRILETVVEEGRTHR
jgi:phosphatidylinositol alpha-1,6-mannosyltransferase